eukprot:gene19722-26413_t
MITPTESDGSRLVSCYETQRRVTLKMKVAGWLCAPVLCIGCCCLVPAWALDACISNLGQFIEFCTAPKLHQMAALVKHEQRLFVDAFMAIGNSVVFPNMRLLDALRYGKPGVYAVIKLDDHFIVSPSKHAAAAGVWEEYCRRGGNVSVLVCCLPEFMAMYASPDNEAMCEMYDKLRTDTVLARFVSQRKAAYNAPAPQPLAALPTPAVA